MRSIAGTILLTTALALGSSGLAAQAPELVAPVYPGAVPERADAAAVAATTWRVTYLSNAPLGEVVAYYDGALGADRRHEENRLESDDPRVSWVMIPLREALRLTGEPLSEAPSTRSAGVSVEAVHPARESGAVSAPNVVSQLVSDLRAVVRASGADPAPYEEAIARNGDLARSYYPVVDRGPRGEAVRFDRQVYERCEREIRPGGGGPVAVPEVRELSDEEAEALAAEMQKLYAAGKFEEAQKLMERLAGGPAPSPAAGGDEGNALRSMADQWVACLDELRPRAYTTRITIDTHPTTWDWRAARER